MIALVRLLPPPSAASCGTAMLPALPSSPASRYSGFFVRCDGAPQMYETLEWYADLRERRPAVPLGLVCPPDLNPALRIFPHPVAPVLASSEVPDKTVPRQALEEIRRTAVDGKIFDELVNKFGARVLSERRLVNAIVARAVAGNKLYHVARDLGVCEETVRRRLKLLGLEAGDFMSYVRVRAYDLRIKLGVAAMDALFAGNWNSQEDRRRCAGRVRKKRARVWEFGCR